MSRFNPFSKRRRALAFACAGTLGALALPQLARAQTDAVRKVIVGFPAGGLADRLGRIVAEALSQASSSPYIVENRSGAGGMVASEQVARAESDGRTLLLHNVDVMVLDRVLKADSGLDPLRSLAIVAPVARFEYYVVAHAKLGLRGLPDLVALGRGSPTSLFYVDAGPTVRLVFENLKKKFDLNLVGVPYRGLAPAMADLLAGRVELAMLDGATAPAQVAAGKLTLLGRGDALSARDAAPVPTLIEQGAGDLWVDTRFALMAPAATPAATVESLRSVLSAVLKKPAVRGQLEQAAYHPITDSHERFSGDVAESVEHYRRLARQAGMI